MIDTKIDPGKVSLLDETIDMLRKLDLEELKAVQSVIKVFISKDDDYYRPLSETELITRIDGAIAQVDAGFSYDAIDVENEII